MVHHLLLEHLIMVILLQELSRMSSVDMLFKLVITFLEDSVGIVTDFLLNMKSINNLKSQIRDKSWKWVSLNTTNIAEILS